MACAFWVGEAAFLQPEAMEPIGSVDKHGRLGGLELIPKDRFKLVGAGRCCVSCYVGY